MAKRITKEEKTLLSLLGNSEDGFLYLSPEKVEPLVKRGWAEQHPGMEEDGKFATRLTAEGFAKFKGLEEPKVEVVPEPETTGGYVGEVEIEEETEEVYVHETLTADVIEEETEVVEVVTPAPKKEPKAKTVSTGEVFTVELEKNIPVPPRIKKLRGSYKYPFEKMEVGDSFHVPVSDKMPKPWRTLASTASTATKKFGKKFVVRSVGEDDPKGVGARVFRLE